MNVIRKVGEKYRNMPAEAKAVIWFTICGVVQKCISFLTTPLFTRILTEEQYGQVVVYNSWVDLLTVVITLNLFYGSFNTAMVKYEKERDEYVSSITSLVLCLVSFFAIVFFVFRKWTYQWLNMPELFFFVMFVQIYFQSVTNMWMARKRFEYKYISVIVLTLSIFLLSPILSVLVVVNTVYRAEARVVVYAIVYVGVGLFLLVNIYRRGKKFFSCRYWNYAFRFNLPLVPHYLASTVLTQADRIMIERMIGLETAAVYSVAYSLSMALSIITTSVNQAFTPWLYTRLKEKQYKEIPGVVYRIIAVSAVLLVCLMLFGPEAISILAPESYGAAVWAIPPIAASILFMFIYQLFANIEFYYGKSSYIMFASIGSAILNVILNYIFIPRFGFLAAAYTTLVCYVAFSMTHYFFAKSILLSNGGQWNVQLAKILQIVLCFFVTVVITMLLYTNDILRYSAIATLVIMVVWKRKRVYTLLSQAMSFKTMKEK